MPDSIELSDLSAGVPQAQLKNSLHMQHQNPEWEDSATGSACMGNAQSGSEAIASRAQQGQHRSQHGISCEAAAAEIGSNRPEQAREVAQASDKELARTLQAEIGVRMDGSVAGAQLPTTELSAVQAPQHVRHLQAQAQPDTDSASGDCTVSDWRKEEACPSAAPPRSQACMVLAATPEAGTLPGAPGISLSIFAEAVPSEADAEGADLSADAEAPGACLSQQMSRASHSKAGAADDEGGTSAQGACATQATRDAQQRGNELYSHAVDNEDGISVSVSQCNMKEVPEESISELAGLAPVGWQREFEAGLYRPLPGRAGQVGNAELAAGQLTRPAQSAAATQQDPRSHSARKAPAAGRPQLAGAIRRDGARGQGSGSVAGPADNVELEAVPAVIASQGPAAVQQRRRGRPRKLAVHPAEGPAAEHGPEARPVAVPAAEASQASDPGQRQKRPSLLQTTLQSKGQQLMMSLYISLYLSLSIPDALLQPWHPSG